VPDAVHELIFSDIAREKLGRRGISVAEARQLPGNPHDIPENPHAPPGTSRRQLVGETNGGRRLILVIERTHEPTAWLVVTGWQSA
jgi:uncharacterized DUF497 family protein